MKLYKDYGLSSLYQLRAEHLLVFMYKRSKDVTKLDIVRPKIELRSRNKVKLFLKKSHP